MEGRELLVAGAAAMAGGAAAAALLLRKRKSAADKERERRLRLNARGRITEGSLVQLVERHGERLLAYQYAVAGVTYQAVQDISTLAQGARLEGHCEGLPVRIKYDQRNPFNSIVVCEGWSGLE